MSHPTQATWSPSSLKPQPRSPLGTMDLQELPSPSSALKHPRVCVAASAALMTPHVALAGHGTGLEGIEVRWSQPHSSKWRTQQPPKHITSFPAPNWLFPFSASGAASPSGAKAETQSTSLVFFLPHPQHQTVTPPDLSALPSKPLLAPLLPLCPHPHPYHHPGPSHHHLS